MLVQAVERLHCIGESHNVSLSILVQAIERLHYQIIYLSMLVQAMERLQCR